MLGSTGGPADRSGSTARLHDLAALPPGPPAPGIALWALALYLPLSVPLQRLEQALAEGSLGETAQQVVLTLSSLLLALGCGAVVEVALGWALGPGWATSSA